jgi:hypothetical protein
MTLFIAASTLEASIGLLLGVANVVFEAVAVEGVYSSLVFRNENVFADGFGANVVPVDVLERTLPIAEPIADEKLPSLRPERPTISDLSSFCLQKVQAKQADACTCEKMPIVGIVGRSV